MHVWLVCSIWKLDKAVLDCLKPSWQKLVPMILTTCAGTLWLQLLCAVTLTFKFPQVWRQIFFRLKKKTKKKHHSFDINSISRVYRIIAWPIRPFPNTSAPARLRLPVPHVSTKPLKSSLSLHAKILFYVWNEWIKYCRRYHYEVNRSVLHVNC